MNPAQLLSKGFDLTLGKFTFSPSYVQVVAIIVLLFILVLTLAQIRRHFVNWSFKGALFGIFFGFILAIILEGFLIIGGKTAITQVLGWKDAPKPITAILEAGKDQLIKVLGDQVEEAIPAAISRINPTFKDGITFFQSLDPAEAQKFKDFICRP